MLEYEDDPSDGNESTHSLDNEFGAFDVPLMRTHGVQKAIATENQKLCHSTEVLAASLALRKVVYGKDTPIYVTVDTSPTRIGWVINQEDDNGTRFPIRFGAKVLSE